MVRRHMASEPAAGAAGPQRPSPGRRLARYALISLLTVLAVIAGWAAAALVFFAVAAAASAIPLLLAAAVAACLLAATGGGRLAAKLARLAHPGRYAAGAGLAGTALLAGVCSATVLQPLPSAPWARHQPAAPAGVRYWRLPTGSRLAYLKVPARGPARPDPVIFVGGGPGEEDVANTSQTRFFGQLSQLGYRVYFYDQLGSGLSQRLANPAGYTFARQAADLDAIRQRIGARQVILLGSSWGGSLVASYLASHPRDVASAVFTSPAPISYAQWPDPGSVTSRLRPAQQQRADSLIPGNPRFIAWYALGQINPVAAHRLVPDAEADAFFSTFLQRIEPATVCDPARLPHQPGTGNGLYDNVFTARSAQQAHTGTRALLASDHTPALILTGGCNYIKWAPTWQYKTILPNSRLVCFPGAGHVIYLDQPRPYLQTIESFLLGKPLPVRPWTSARPCQRGA